ncbi:hypothetical protein PFISCL1PPCAC_10296, partial [Pristionchus fissidentatus]
LQSLLIIVSFSSILIIGAIVFTITYCIHRHRIVKRRKKTRLSLPSTTNCSGSENKLSVKVSQVNVVVKS